MNRQKAIDELDKTANKFFRVATSLGVEANNRTLSTGVFAGIGIAKSVIEQLDEPQKVKVKPFVAEWFEENKSDLDRNLWALTITISEKRESSYFKLTSFERWFFEESETYITLVRMLDGYEVEEEPKWIVCYSTMYLKRPIGSEEIETVEITPKKELAYRFESYEAANQQTSFIGGAVEKV